jgi:hypothetical protein
LPSSQLSEIGVPTQTPAEHWSPVVFTFPSSHAVPSGIFVCWQAPLLHESVVQTLPSSLQAVPLALFACVQLPALHTSLVQRFPSSVHTVPLSLLLETHVPLLQVSGLSQSVLVELPHAVTLALIGCVQLPALHASLVQRFPSSVHSVPLAS